MQLPVTVSAALFALPVMFGTIQSASAAKDSALDRWPGATMTELPWESRNWPARFPFGSAVAAALASLTFVEPSRSAKFALANGVVVPRNFALPRISVTPAAEASASSVSLFGETQESQTN